MIFAVADTHLSFANNKPMHVFHQKWLDHPLKLKTAWRHLVGAEDLTLVAGDISWASKLQEAAQDLVYLHDLPGQKLLSKGNHDYWWSTLGKMEKFAGELALNSLHFLVNNAYLWVETARELPGFPLVATNLQADEVGDRFGASSCFDNLIAHLPCLIKTGDSENYDRDFLSTLAFWQKKGVIKCTLIVGTKAYLLPSEWKNAHDRELYERELYRLELSYRSGCSLLRELELSPAHTHLIVMTHYPPLEGKMAGRLPRVAVGAGTYTPLQAKIHEWSATFARTFAVYGHLHGLGIRDAFTGTLQAVDYRLCSLDALDFRPLPL